ncbi:uncharacterized protein B0H64DRAFT_381381 [Chaetomium fimeti]|uniref:Major facilitator superfamily (MFS) profile domain-containing protein n=1 Tax=Chaetomium fimeti TaxID=1854472 RepID=A0AAE0HQ60_9PEZI|nr:hypothetical protein B0H64DRAFT_381381 [Chaetomium fimeti]
MDPSDEKAAATGVEHADLASRENDVTVQLAHDADDTVYSPWSPRMLRLYLVLSLSYLCGCLNGYDGSLMGGLNGMISYQKYFNM